MIDTKTYAMINMIALIVLTLMFAFKSLVIFFIGVIICYVGLTYFHKSLKFPEREEHFLKCVLSLAWPVFWLFFIVPVTVKNLLTKVDTYIPRSK